jgi:hypothetical protein
MRASRFLWCDFHSGFGKLSRSKIVRFYNNGNLRGDNDSISKKLARGNMKISLGNMCCAATLSIVCELRGEAGERGEWRS